MIRIAGGLDLASGFCGVPLRIIASMLRVQYVRRRFVAAAIACVLIAACSHSNDSNDANLASGSQGAGSTLGGAAPQARSTLRPTHPSDGYQLAEIAVARLGGPNAPAAPRVTGVSVVENYGLAVYDIGTSKQELLSIKEGGKWRPLGTDAYVSSGRGLVHFGLSPDLANRLIEELAPPPDQ